MIEGKQEVHICPILMRTVIFEDDCCTEDCQEEDCPIFEGLKGGRLA